MEVLRRIDREQFHMDYQTMSSRGFEGEIEELGSKIFLGPSNREPVAFGRSLRRLIHDEGPYDIIHGHRQQFNGYVLRRAKDFGVPVRIAHSHATGLQGDRVGPFRRIYNAYMASLMARYATGGLAASEVAAQGVFGNAWRANPRWKILHYGVDLEPFQAEVDRAAVRSELGIPDGRFVLGNVGRFSLQKNHSFLIDIFAEVVRRDPNVSLLLVGDGPTNAAIRKKVDDNGLTDHVVFAGYSSNVPRLMLGAMDVFVMPSLFEGLPISLIEAQAAALPCVVSGEISREVSAPQDMVQFISLESPPSTWAEAILSTRDLSKKVDRSKILELMKESSFNIWNCVSTLERFYLECHERVTHE